MSGPVGRRTPPRALAALLLLVFGAAACAPARKTPLEAADFRRYSTSREISAYLDALAAHAPGLARKDVLGESVQGRPIEALVLAAPASEPARPRLKVLLVGSQHGGAEPAGGEALLSLARDLLEGDLRPLLDELEIVLIPNANPDGRDLKRRSNANRVNINTDFVLLSQPESRALVDALARYAPDAVLDTHESAVLKRSTLAREGYLTDFDAQFEVANAPGLPPDVQAYARDSVLPALLARVSAGGLPANHYIGEITSTRQPITHGGLTLRNFRNSAGTSGALSVLVETKLDPRTDAFATYRNIAVRVERQRQCIRGFLAEAQARRVAIREQVAAARAAAPPREITLYAGYAPDPRQRTVSIPLRHLDSRLLESKQFADHRRRVTADTVPVPTALIVTRHTGAVGELLDRHGIAYTAFDQAARLPVQVLRLAARPAALGRVAAVQDTQTVATIPAGSLRVDLAQPAGRLALLLIDPRSISSVFRYPQYGAWIEPGEAFFVYRQSARLNDRARQP
ncbi:MAG: M14 family zinc carboxypeptidase [Pseudomonadota bacterium]